MQCVSAGSGVGATRGRGSTSQHRGHCPARTTQHTFPQRLGSGVPRGDAVADITRSEDELKLIPGDAAGTANRRTYLALISPPPPCVTFRQVVVSLRGPGRSPVVPFACCVGLLLSVGRCGQCSCWCCFPVRGAQQLVCWAVLNVAWCAVCVSAAPNNWRIEDVLIVAGVV